MWECLFRDEEGKRREKRLPLKETYNVGWDGKDQLSLLSVLKGSGMGGSHLTRPVPRCHCGAPLLWMLLEAQIICAPETGTSM